MPSQYRAVCLEAVGLKLAASVMLARLSVEVGETRSKKSSRQSSADLKVGLGKGKDSSNSNRLFANLTGQRKEKYLPRTQAGFRKGRSTRDNSYALRTLINLAIELRTRLCITFFDLKQAFDSVSHACLEEAPRDAGASDKGLQSSLLNGKGRCQGRRGRRLALDITRI